MDNITAKELVERVAARASRLGAILVSAEEFTVRYQYAPGIGYEMEAVTPPSYITKIDREERAACAAAREELQTAARGANFHFVSASRVGTRLWVEAQVDSEYVEQVILLDD